MSAKGLEDLENDRMMKNSSHGELQKVFLKQLFQKSLAKNFSTIRNIYLGSTAIQSQSDMKYLAIAILIVLTASSSYTIKDESSILNQFWKEIVQEKENSPVGGKGGGVTWVNFCWVCALASQSPYPYSLANYRPHLRHFWANM